MQMPLEASDTIYFEDSSLVYFRGKHGLLCSPPGPGYERRCSDVSMLPPLDPTAVIHGAACADKARKPEVSAFSLYQICKSFIAKNLHLVESLVDFPEAVGHDLFMEALGIQIFHKSPDYLNKFCVAYKSLVLKHLSLKKSTVIIDENFKFLQCFNSLTKLDLGHCRLGDNHEYLQWTGKMKSLKCVCLKDNCLTDTGVSSWTLPHRMLNSGPEFLRTLDLSCNPEITDLCAKYLVRFSHLKSLNLSGTKITIACGINRITSSTCLKMVSYIPEFSKEVFTKTKGWASLFVTELPLRSIPKKVKNQFQNTFYQAAGPSALKVDEIKTATNTGNYPVMLLQSEELVLPNTLRIVDAEPLSKQNKKRVTVRNGKALSLASVKRPKIDDPESNNVKKPIHHDEEISANDTQLLDSFLQYLW